MHRPGYTRHDRPRRVPPGSVAYRTLDALDLSIRALLSCLFMNRSRCDIGATAVRGFPPLSDARARVLVLGSMPGVASLRAGQYYGHPRNAFWTIMGSLFGFAGDAPYAQRVASLLEHRVAVWDVLAACERKGSLDADIVATSMLPNDFGDFFARHRAIVRICCNGAAAHRLYLRQVAPIWQSVLPLDIIRLPSTSPAFAGMTLAGKFEAWKQVR